MSEQQLLASPAVPCFTVGDRVRVVRGTADPDYPDIPLGGWAGTVVAVDAADAGPLLLVQWNEATLAAAPPVYRRRCLRDDLEHQTTWLPAGNLEADPGEPVSLEQPGELTPRPLDLDDPADRARRVLGLTSDDDLPPVSPEGLRRFHAHLSKSVRLPFTAGLDLGGAVIGSGLRPVLVTKLWPIERCLEFGTNLRVEVAHEEERLDVPLELLQPAGGTTAADLAAYRAWLGADAPPAAAAGLPLGPFVKLALLVVLLAGLLGTLLEALPETQPFALVAASVLGVLGGLFGARYEGLFRAANRLPPNVLGGLLLGLVLGCAAGAGLGALLAAYAGAIPGALAGTLLGWLLARLGRPGPGILLLTFLGACAGAGLVAFLSDADLALAGLWHGLVAGLVAGVVVVLGVLAYLRALFSGHE